MQGRVVYRVLVVLVVLAALAAAAFFAYNAGVAQGLAQNANPQTGTQPVAPFWGFGWPFFFWPFGFPFLFILVPIGLILLFRFLLFGLFWGGYRRGYGPGGRWGHDVPTEFEEWHRRMHEEKKEG